MSDALSGNKSAAPNAAPAKKDPPSQAPTVKPSPSPATVKTPTAAPSAAEAPSMAPSTGLAKPTDTPSATAKNPAVKDPTSKTPTSGTRTPPDSEGPITAPRFVMSEKTADASRNLAMASFKSSAPSPKKESGSPTARPTSVALANNTQVAANTAASAPQERTATRGGAGNASTDPFSDTAKTNGGAGNGDFTLEADAARISTENGTLDSGQVQQALRFGIPTQAIEGMNPDQLGSAVRAVNLGLSYDADAATVEKTAVTQSLNSPQSAEYQEDVAARTKINDLLAKPDFAALEYDGTVNKIPMPGQASAAQEQAFRLRIDTRGMSPDQIKASVSRKIAEINGVKVPEGTSTPQVSKDNMQRSLKWLAAQPNSGIVADARDPNFEGFTHAQMLQGYRNVYGMPSDATWADVMTKWQDRNPARAEQAGLTERPLPYYERISGVYDAVNGVTSKTLTPKFSGPPPLTPDQSDFPKDDIRPPDLPPDTVVPAPPKPGDAGSSATLPGTFGRNLAKAFQGDPTLLEKGLQITPKDNPDTDDFFGYAEADLALGDKDQNKILSKAEFTALYQALPEAARANLFKALDVNKNDSLELNENTAQILTQIARSNKDGVPPFTITQAGMDMLSGEMLLNPEAIRAELEITTTSKTFQKVYQDYQDAMFKAQGVGKPAAPPLEEATPTRPEPATQDPATKDPVTKEPATGTPPPLPGAVGRQLAQEVLKGDFDQSLAKGIQISPATGGEGIANVFSFADVTTMGQMDQDKDGIISQAEYNKAYNTAYKEIPQADLDRFFSALDVNRNKALSLDELAAHLQERITRSSGPGIPPFTLNEAGSTAVREAMRRNPEAIRQTFEKIIATEGFQAGYTAYLAAVKAAQGTPQQPKAE